VSALGAALSTELLKARRSRVPWAIAAGFSLAPIVGGLFMVILKDPEGARRLGLLGAKAQIAAGTADWPTFLALLTQAEAMGGGVLLAFLTAWLYGREFSDRTVRTLLAIPTPRWAMVTAKLLVLAVWGIALTAWILVLGLAIGAGVGLPGWSASLAMDAVGRIALSALLLMALQTTTAFVAGYGHGYLPPLGWTVLMVFLAQVLAALGWGASFPWAVPALVAGLTGPGGEVATVGSFIVVGVVSLVGLAATFA
jgi:ABC-2 type transport system permease protein